MPTSIDRKPWAVRKGGGEDSKRKDGSKGRRGRGREGGRTEVREFRKT